MSNTFTVPIQYGDDKNGILCCHYAHASHTFLDTAQRFRASWTDVTRKMQTPSAE